MNNRKIICLCGSTKFKEEFDKCNRDFTLQGYIVLSVGVFAHYDNIELNYSDKLRLDDLHKDKILMSDVVFIINKDWYIGDSTKSEIEFAHKNGKKVFYLFNEDLDSSCAE